MRVAGEEGSHSLAQRGGVRPCPHGNDKRAAYQAFGSA
jgi:hypothetical protein